MCEIVRNRRDFGKGDIIVIVEEQSRVDHLLKRPLRFIKPVNCAGLPPRCIDDRERALRGEGKSTVRMTHAQAIRVGLDSKY